MEQPPLPAAGCRQHGRRTLKGSCSSVHIEWEVVVVEKKSSRVSFTVYINQKSRPPSVSTKLLLPPPMKRPSTVPDLEIIPAGLVFAPDQPNGPMRKIDHVAGARIGGSVAIE